ncbi:MAG: glycerate kinase, partial [Tenericutes bacterium]|nr:glycerate kinase [Mycoplasmatota bacterium]
IGLGGSSTNDGGAGMLQALGVKFLNKKHQEIKRMTGLSIAEVEEIDLTNLDTRLREIEILTASDVENPLLGSHGCAKVYARQKGASEEMIKSLEENMNHYSKTVVGKLGKDYREFPGSGAAGGLGFAMKTFLNANLRSGFEIVSSCIRLENMIKSSDIIITGEGKFDRQSFHGKVPVKIAELGKKYHKSVIGLFGQSEVNKPAKLFDEFYCIVPEISSKETSLNKPKETFIKLIKEVL